MAEKKNKPVLTAKKITAPKKPVASAKASKATAKSSPKPVTVIAKQKAPVKPAAKASKPTPVKSQPEVKTAPAKAKPVLVKAKPAPAKVKAPSVKAKVAETKDAKPAGSKKVPPTAKVKGTSKASKVKTPAKLAVLDLFFKPSGIAVIGASDIPGSAGFMLMQSLINIGYKGGIYPVCPGKKTVLEVKAYPSILKVPGNVDVAILATKKEATKLTITQCTSKKVRGIIMLAPDYEKGSPKNIDELVSILEKSKIRLLGPGTSGLSNGQFGFLNLSKSPANVKGPGGFLITDTGVLAGAVIGHAAFRGFDIGKVLTLGKKLDLDEGEALLYAKDDAATSFIMLSLEAFSDPGKIVDVFTGISRVKPLVAMKPASASAGQKAVSSPLAPGLGLVHSFVWDKAGVIACDTFNNFVDTSLALSLMPIPEGGRVGIVAQGSELAAFAMQSAIASGLTVPEFSQKVQVELAKALPGSIVTNPIAVSPDSGAAGYYEAIQAMVKENSIDLIIAIYVPQNPEADSEVARMVSKSWTDMKSKRKLPKPVFPVWISGPASAGDNPANLLKEKGLPVFAYPSDAVNVAANLADYRTWLSRPIEEIPSFKVEVAKAERILTRAYAEKREYLDDAEGQDLLNYYGIPTVTTVVTGSLVAAKKHATKLGYPLALKGTAPGLIDKIEMKAVVYNIHSEREMVSAYQKVEAQLKKKWGKPFRIMLQPMYEEGLDLNLRSFCYAGFPPLLMFGLGGVFSGIASLLDFKLTPLNNSDASDLVERSAVSPILKGGVGGREGIDFGTLTQLVLRFSQLLNTHRQIVAAEINPLRAVPGEKFVVLDQLFRLKV